MDATVCFLGGVATTDNLTGSCAAIEVRCGKKTTVLLVDAGLVQGDAKNFFTNNTRILKSIEPARIDYIIATHAHIDHIGLLPLLVNRGFNGKVICTKQTADLMPIMLADSYKVQKELASRRRKIDTPRRFNRKKTKRRKEVVRRAPQTGMLYSDTDVAKTLSLIWRSGFDFETVIRLSNFLSLKFYPSGHILGGAICAVELANRKARKVSRLCFSGDLGRQEGLLLDPPKIIKERIDHWFTESTYGDRNHPKRNSEITRLRELVLNAKKNGGKIIIPSFALQRSQEIIYLLSAAIHKGEIPKMPIFLDSPMANKITDVFAKHWEAGTFKRKDNLPFNPFSEENPYLTFIRGSEESAKLAESDESYIVISSSGMCDAGRVRDHLRVGLPNEKTTICLVGYMAPSSLGRKLQDGIKTVRMNGQEIAIKATIEKFDSFSAHADSSELVDYAKSAMAGASNRSITILHGEIAGGISLQASLDRELSGRNIKVSVPALGAFMRIII